ncbi:conserved hypothetical protein [Formosa agariphila KMM 3901]|uniref:Uncharacterized protein n=1 Tax=Formosa agariphila (strain DSM 15362 / KCTC 12365 / LMG 23005 / KMM 3901 / M-2Alg 35-1) TaxID=1347342 RepID=T2KNG1_FORAG|nr:hypothetical protein [Formosa agariphila]CDF80407.1 conserved hypothetical protein [Formosa agariphila KMM 3901]
MNISNEFAKHESDYIKQYQDKGYTANYQVVDAKLVDLETKETFKPESVKIVAEHRYEGMSNPSDMSILYVIETSSESKGTFLAGFGPTSNLEDSEFFNAIPESNISENKNILKDD